MEILKPIEIVAETAKEFLQKVVTPPLEEIGLLIADRVKLWRFKNQIAIISKADEILRSKNIKTRKVSLKVMVPLLEECSLEEDEDLKIKWAKLLANTVAEESNINSTLYTYILSQLSIQDAVVFDCACKIGINHYDGNETRIQFGLDSFTGNIELQKDELQIKIDNLIRLRLIRELAPVSNEFYILTITDLGLRFKDVVS